MHSNIPTSRVNAAIEYNEQILSCLAQQTLYVMRKPQGITTAAIRKRLGTDLSPEEVVWLRTYDGAPCDTLDKAVSLVLLWREWQQMDKQRGSSQ